MSTRNRRSLYQPLIADEHIRLLYRIKISTGIPMTRLADAALDVGLALIAELIGEPATENERSEGLETVASPSAEP
jgi:hypothetical protein